MFWRKGELYPFTVVVHLGGRHPYLKEHHLDFKTQDVTVHITARNWKHAEHVALGLGNLPQSWRRSVKSIARGHQ